MVPEISVLLPAYRSAKFVRRALDALLAQTCSNFEVVAVDNASDDGTYDILEEYARRDRRFRVFQNPTNIGPVGNWKRCAELATSPLAHLLFSDDWPAPDFLEQSRSAMVEPHIGFVCSPTLLWRLDQKDSDPINEQKTLYSFGNGGEFHRKVYWEMIYGDGVYPRLVSPAASVFRTDDLRRGLARSLPLADEAKYDSHGAGPDLAVYFEATLRYTHFRVLPGPCMNFLARPDAEGTKPLVNYAYTATKLGMLGLIDAPLKDKDRWRASLCAGLLLGCRFSSRNLRAVRWAKPSAIDVAMQIARRFFRALARRAGISLTGRDSSSVAR